MNKIKAFIEAEAVLLVAVLLAAFTSIGGTALVLGAVPDDNGQIHACRSNDTGVVRIIDTESESCNGSETEIDWDQFGNPVVHDASGQLLGNMVDSRHSNDSPLVIYNPILKRNITIDYTQEGHYAIVSLGYAFYFENDDCTGQAYVYDDPHLGIMTNLLRTDDSSYGIVDQATPRQSMTVGSLRQYVADSDTFSCTDVDNYADNNAFKVDSASLPFNLPLTEPFKF